MMTLETTQTVPLTLTEDGTIRIKGSRVSLDSIVYHFKLGATAEQIAHKFPALELADIYAAITYYLNHRETVDEYLRQQEVESDALQQRIKSASNDQTACAEMRSRLLARWSARR
jgi:uncharacterized protein (DUF433 family)